MQNQESKNNKPMALVFTLGIHGLIVLFLYLFIIKTPIPPFPESGSNGLEVNFGLDASGMGEEQPMSESEIAMNTNQSETPIASSESEEVVTQEIEESVAVENKKETKKKKKKKEEKEVKKETKTEIPPTTSNSVKEVIKKEPEKVAAVALYKGNKNKNSKSEGDKGGTGDQGDPDGSPDVKYHGKRTGSGTGDGNGNGTGTGDGDGNSPGIGKGNGKPNWDLTGRKNLRLPVPNTKFTEEGKVVVQIKVNQSGNVISAKAGVKGSTTSDPTLLDIAKKAALTAKFNENPDAPEEQVGTIVYNFILSR
jgi:outer membrane biosynthesis protein TonB